MSETSFIHRELDRINNVILGPISPDRYRELYVAQQALSWALDPSGYAAPYDVIQQGRVQPPTDIPAG